MSKKKVQWVQLKCLWFQSVHSHCLCHLLSPSACTSAGLACLARQSRPLCPRGLCPQLSDPVRAVAAAVTRLQFVPNMKAARNTTASLLSSRHAPPCRCYQRQLLGFLTSRVLSSLCWSTEMRVQNDHARRYNFKFYKKILVLFLCRCIDFFFT